MRKTTHFSSSAMRAWLATEPCSRSRSASISRRRSTSASPDTYHAMGGGGGMR